MTRRELLDRVGWLGAGLFVAPLHGKFGPDRDAELSNIAQNQPDTRRRVQTLAAMEYLVVTPEGPRDGGHFGKHTPGTRTAGLQEAFDYAKANSKDIYICGGGLKRGIGQGDRGGVGYVLQETLRIPWMQDFRLDGGEYVLVYDQAKGDAVVLDKDRSSFIVHREEQGSLCPERFIINGQR